MKRWMVYVLVVAAVAAIILIITLPRSPKQGAADRITCAGSTRVKSSLESEAICHDEKVDEVALELIDGPGDLSGFSYTFEPGFSYAGRSLSGFAQRMNKEEL
jgi:hypothetical protein